MGKLFLKGHPIKLKNARRVGRGNTYKNPDVKFPISNKVQNSKVKNFKHFDLRFYLTLEIGILDLLSFFYGSF